MKNKNLKRCPFCGSKAKLFKDKREHKPWGVVCQNGECLCNVRLLYCDNEEQAITQWNTRKDNYSSIKKILLEHIQFEIKQYKLKHRDIKSHYAYDDCIEITNKYK